MGSEILTRRLNQALIGVALGAVVGFVLTAVGLAEIFKLSVGLILPCALIGGVIGLTPFRDVLTVLAVLALVGILILQYSPLAEHLGKTLVRRDVIPANPPDAVA